MGGPASIASDELSTADATQLADWVRRGDVTPVELLDRVIARIEALEPHLNAVATRTFERARDRVGRVDREAPFAGVPYLIKDMIDCRGVRRTDGAHVAFERIPQQSPAYMQAVEASGLTVVGVTNVPEFATLPTTVNLRFGATVNPWSPMRTPAGSSGGSAVAVAAGYVPMAHATDGAGSIRLPASHCGVFGFKPSRARTLSGEASGGHDLIKHHHGISRSVRDSARLLAVTEDPRPGARYPAIGLVTHAAAERSIRRDRPLRVGVDAGGLAGLTPDAETARALDRAVALLGELGVEVVEAPAFGISAETFWRHMTAIFAARMPALRALTERIAERPFAETKLLSPLTMSFSEETLALPADALARAEAYLGRLEHDLVERLAEIDVVLSPVAPTVPLPIDVFSPNEAWSEQLDGILAFMNYTALGNATGAPAMSVPLHWTDNGLPIGSHFMARPGDDRRLLELAYRLEAARPWDSRWPALSAPELGLA